MLFYVGSFSYNFTSHVLIYLGSFSCTLHASWCGQSLLHVLCCSVWGVSLTRPMLFYVESFSYTPLAVSRGEFLLHAPCCFMWGVSLQCPAVLCREFVLHTQCYSFLKVCLTVTHPVLFCVFALHTMCCFMWRVFLTHHVLSYVGNLCYTPCSILCGKFVWHTPF